MRRLELLLAGILVPLDFIMLLAAAWTAYFVRFDPQVLDIREAVYVLTPEQYALMITVWALGMVVVFALAGMYETTSSRRVLGELQKVILACSAGMMLVILWFFFNRDLFSSRFIIVSAWAISIAYVFAMRFLVVQIERLLFKKGIGVHNVLLIGQGHTAQIIENSLNSNTSFGLRVVERTSGLDSSLIDKLKKIIRIKEVNEIILADVGVDRTLLSQIISFCRNYQIGFKYAADVLDAQSVHVTMRPIQGVPIVELQPTPIQGWGKIFKRMLDILISVVAITLTWPIMLMVAIAIRIESKGSIIYRNRRVGQGRAEFDTLKFRSMKQEFSISDDNPNNAAALELEQKLIASNSIKEGPIYKIKDDPRVTKVGNFIRKTSLDELPQFFNVLFGTMSVVGPRPHQPREVAGYSEEHHSLFTIKPGITGLAQISGRSDLEFEEEMRLDQYYMENWSLLLDLYIVFKTPFVLLKKRQAA